MGISRSTRIMNIRNHLGKFTSTLTHTKSRLIRRATLDFGRRQEAARQVASEGHAHLQVQFLAGVHQGTGAPLWLGM